MYDYLIHEGDFTVEEEAFIFNGKMVPLTDAMTSKCMPLLSWRLIMLVWTGSSFMKVSTILI